MTEQLFNLDTNDKLIKVGFTIKQAVFSNPSPNPIYVNYSGLIPSASKFELLVQGNSIVTTQALFKDTIYTHQDTIDPKRQATVTIYDNVNFPAGNVPFIARQNIASLVGYPLQINVTNANAFSLPDIFIPNFKNVYFLVNVTQSQAAFTLDGRGFINEILNYGDWRIINYVYRSPKIITFTPSYIGVNHQFRVTPHFLNTSLTAIIDAVQTDDLINVNNQNAIRSAGAFNLTNTFNLKDVFFAKPPGFYFSVEIFNLLGALTNYNLNVKLIFPDRDAAIDSHFVYARNLVGAIPAIGVNVNIPYLIAPTFIPVTFSGFVFAYVQDTTGLLDNTNGLIFNFYNLDE